MNKGYYCIGSRSTGEVVVIPYGENTPKRHLKDVRATKREAISAYIFDTLVLLDSARRLRGREERREEMSKTKFTPGPWEAGENACMTTILDGHEGKTIYPQGSSYHIAWTNAETSDGNLDIETALANARLIAAAPEMYEELERIADILEDPEDCGEISLDRINFILRKVRGESEAHHDDP